jgi:hypothetical protein
VFTCKIILYSYTHRYGRRYKILNPERLRAEYGKLMYVLQDSQIPEVQEMLHFSLKMPIKTVYELLEVCVVVVVVIGVV